MKSATAGIIAALVVVTILVGLRAFFVVRVDQFAIVTEFGKPVREVTEPGLFVRIPFVQQVKYLDRRIRGWDDSQRDTKTADSRQIDYTAYGRWQVAQPLTFYKAVGTEKRAHGVMDSIVTGRIQTRIRANKLAAIVRETGRTFEARATVDPRNIFDVYRECNPAVNPEFRKTLVADPMGKAPTADLTSALRSALVTEIIAEANAELIEGYGIRIRDLHFKYLNYSEQVHADIIRQIQADRLDDISAYLEIGQKCVGYINRITDAERGEIIGSGQGKARELGGEAVAKAIEIKSTAFGQDPELYMFLRNLELYEDSMDEQTRLILSTSSPLLQLMEDPDILEPVAAKPVKAAPRPVPQKVQPAPVPAPPVNTPTPRAVPPVEVP